MKKKLELKKDSFHTEMISGNGIRKIKDLNFGIFLMEITVKESISVYSR